MPDLLFHTHLSDSEVLCYEFSAFSCNHQECGYFNPFFLSEPSDYSRAFMYLVDIKLSFPRNIFLDFECHFTF